VRLLDNILDLRDERCRAVSRHGAANALPRRYGAHSPRPSMD
jgi:hypothetical protein